jgi:hypothetical protein
LTEPDSKGKLGLFLGLAAAMYHEPSALLQHINVKEFIQLQAVLRIRIRIQRIHMFLGFPDRDPLVRGIDPDPALDLDPDPSIIMQK